MLPPALTCDKLHRHRHHRESENTSMGNDMIGFTARGADTSAHSHSHSHIRIYSSSSSSSSMATKRCNNAHAATTALAGDAHARHCGHDVQSLPFSSPTQRRVRFSHAARLMAVCVLTTCMLSGSHALPHNLLVRGCDKGLMLVNRSGPLPAIMSGAAPDEHPSLIAVYEPLTGAAVGGDADEHSMAFLQSWYQSSGPDASRVGRASTDVRWMERGGTISRGATLEVSDTKS
jgi:hypothetical protein